MNTKETIMFVLRLIWYVIRPWTTVLALIPLMVAAIVLSIVIWGIEGCEYARGINNGS